MKHSKLIGFTAALLMASSVATLVHAQAGLKEEYATYEGGPLLLDEDNGQFGAAQNANEVQAPIYGGNPNAGGGGPVVALSFEGISQYDVAGVQRNFIPPDTQGAIGKTQFMEIVNGGVAVFDKATGTRLSFQSDLSFWAGAGKPGTQGDPRILYNKDADRWIALSFGASVADIQIAVSDTSNALGGWKSTIFTGNVGGFADYPTLAMDKNAIYIGTNNFSGAAGNPYQGTTMNIIPLSNLFSAGAPNVSGLVQFRQDFTGIASDGFALQGVNSEAAGTTGKIIAVSGVANALTRYNVANAGTPGATMTVVTTGIGSDYKSNGLGRQPYTTGVGNPRVIDTLDDRIGASAWEVSGRIYSVHTITKLGTDFTVVRYSIIDSITGALLDEGEIGDATHDYFEGSLAVNASGQVVIAYNRSGSSAIDGKVSFLARAFSTDGTGKLQALGSEMLLHVSDTDSYHNGSVFGQAAAGRQRWGDYSAVTIDPLNSQNFWAIGEFAREFNNAAGGHPGGTGGSRWGTWIAQINLPGAGGAVPEPATWAMMILGFGLVGVAARRRRVTQA